MMKSRAYHRSSSFKMALLFTLLSGLTVIILGYFSYYFSKGHLVHTTEAAIASDIRHFVFLERQGLLEKALQERAHDQDRLYLLQAADKTYLAGTIDAVPDEVGLMAEGTLLFIAGTQGKTYAARIHTFDDGRRMVIGIAVDAIAKAFALMKCLSIVSIVLMLSVILIAFLISVFVVRKTNSIALTAKKIMETGNLSQRIQVESRWDDLSRMADILNDFLERLESLVLSVRQVSDNIAHDLRTPLTRLRNNLERLRNNKESSLPIDRTCDALIQEADQILNTFAALLRISEIEAGQGKYHFQTIELHTLIADVIELYEPLAEQKNIVITTSLPPTVIQADRDLLCQAFANLLDNAIKFTPRAGDIHLSLHRTSSGIVFRIADTGTGIALEEQAKIFDRFYRSETSRHTPGNGLGLSLVAAVIRLHDGTIHVADNNPGLEISISFQNNKLRMA